MELSFVLNALRRYWWLVAVVAAAFTAAGVQAAGGAGAQYESVAVLLVSPPSESRVQVTFNNDPDRYVIGQLSVLRSGDLAERVANRVGEGVTLGEIRRSTTIEHEPRTDIVTITATTGSPDRSRAIAEGYVSEYLLTQQEQVAETRQPEIEALSQRLTELEGQLELVDAGIAQEMEPYLPDGPVGDSGFPPIPAVDMVAPDLVSQRTILLAQYQDVLATRTELTRLDINAKLRVTSEVVQRASVPTEPVPAETTKFALAGLIGGLAVGFALAVLAARLSRTALDVHEVEEVLGHPVVGEFPAARALSKSRRAALEALPASAAQFVDALAVRAEAYAPVDGAVTVAVVGTERGAGSTTLACALANRFATNGSRVLLIDADPRDSELTRHFAAGRPGIPALLALRHEADGARRGGRGVGGAADPFTATFVHGLSVVGIGDKTDMGGLRRQNVPDLIEAASRAAHVVVFDCGPLLDAASTTQLALSVDAVVLAVPTRRLLTRTLSVVASQLRSRRGALLPVLMPTTPKRGSSVPSGPSARDDVRRPGTGGPIALAEPPDVVTSTDRR